MGGAAFELESDVGIDFQGGPPFAVFQQRAGVDAIKR